ncbi:MAG TPA: inorganic phosphate transporter [Candidatus Cybelea sp.]|nr:inorganic phosphate transporter [Candidatus Cybelea sp.]
MGETTSNAVGTLAPPASLLDQKITRAPGKLGKLAFAAAVGAGIVFIVLRLMSDLSGVRVTSAWPYVLLGLALLTALGFEFVNGFHDTANAVATVIYTHSLEPHVAVVWSGAWNLIGVLVSSGAVAFTIVSLLPVELILQVGKGAGFAMVFALLVSAILWNLGTWSLGLPASSSHTLIGSIIGVGLANQLMAVKTGTSGVDWGQAGTVFRSLLVSPIVGFLCAGMLLMLAKVLIREPRLYRAPEGNAPPPFWIRCLLILTCTGVSFGHGSNDGQKGMGLIMLILIGVVPTAYALNHAVGPAQIQDFAAVSEQAINAVNHYVDPQAIVGDTRNDLTDYIRTREFTPTTMLALRQLIGDIEHEVLLYKALAKVPANQQANVRNDMYVVSEALRLMQKSGKPELASADRAALKNYKVHLDLATKFIPTWVKIAVALALGLGTMVGWKRIVITVGEKIGKAHLTYGQGAAAELVTAGTILAADRFGLPVSTTHVLSSGIGGTMAANHSGLQWSTVRNIALAWVLTLPAAAMLAGGLFWLFRQWV